MIISKYKYLCLYICKNISFPNHVFENYHKINIFSTIKCIRE